MKKTMIVGMLGVLFGVAAGTAAQAQTADTTVQKPISIKIGAFFPNDGNVRKATHDEWFKAGVDYAFNKTNTETPLLSSVYVDYAGTDHAQLYSVGLAERGYFGQSGKGTGASFSPYLGAGIGAYFSEASGNGQSKTNTQVGGKIFLGAELNTGPFIEAAYEILPQSTHINGSSYRFDGFDVSVGYRF